MRTLGSVIRTMLIDGRFTASVPVAGRRGPRSIRAARRWLPGRSHIQLKERPDGGLSLAGPKTPSATSAIVQKKMDTESNISGRFQWIRSAGLRTGWDH